MKGTKKNCRRVSDAYPPPPSGDRKTKTTRVRHALSA